jgi:hypothetical protein
MTEKANEKDEPEGRPLTETDSVKKQQEIVKMLRKRSERERNFGERISLRHGVPIHQIV